MPKKDLMFAIETTVAGTCFDMIIIADKFSCESGVPQCLPAWYREILDGD
jgi:hypothetical protein